MSYVMAGVILVGFGISVALTVGSLWLLFSSIVRGNGRTPASPRGS